MMAKDGEFLPAAFIDHMKDDAPDLLYHYSDQKGLLGIFQNAELWCTKVQYMNDTTEFGLALNLARKIISEILGQTPLDLNAPKDIVEPVAHKRDVCHRLAYSLRGLEGINLFAACFCEDGDLLSQWRGYAGGGNGYAIGFSCNLLQRAAERKNFVLGRCIYDCDLQRRIVEEAIAKCLDDELATPSHSQWGEHGPLANILFRCGAFFKDASFAAEREWRLLSPILPYGDDQINFRSGRSMLTPYYRLPLNSKEGLPLLHVVVGPCPHMELSKAAVTGLVMKAGIERISPEEEFATGSAIPFRDW